MATREEYRKKYGATTLGQTGTAQTQKSISDGGVTREDYAKKYGMTTGLGRTSSSGSRRTAMQEAAEGFANSLRSQNQFRGQYTPPDWESAVEAGKQKKSVLSNPYVLDPTKDDIPTMLKGYADELKLAKYRKNYNLSYMTDDEKNNYYYLVGEYGLESGDNYLKQINDSLKQRNAKDIEETGKKVGKTDPLTGILGNVIGSVTSGAGYLQDVADTVRGKEIDRNNVGHRMSGLENATREGLKAAARENIADSSATDFAVDTGLSMAQSLARLPFGYAGLGIAGLSAATGAEEDALSQDVSAKKALAQGTAQGIAEGLFEKFSLGNLKSMQSVPVYSWKDVAKNIAKQMGTEASEEMVTEATNALTDRLIMGDKSQWVQDKENSSTLGAAGALAERIGLAGLGGAVSGGLMGGGGMLVSGINQQRYGRSNALDNYQEIADSIDTDPASYKTAEDAKRAQNLESLARSYAALQARGGEPTAMQQGAFMRDYYDLIPGVKDFSEDTTPIRGETASATRDNEGIQDQADIAQKTQKQETRNAYPYNPNLTDEQIQEIIAKDFADEVAAGEQENQRVAPVQQPESRIEPEETRQTVPETMENVRTERSTENVDYDTLNDYAKGLGENGRKVFVENYDGNLSIDDYQTAYGRYYDAGRYNADMDTAEKSMLASMMTPEQAAAAYKAGAQDRNLAIQTQPEYRQGEARTGSAEDLTGQASAAQKALAQSLGKKTGLRFELVDSSTASGSYEAKNGVVRLNINSKNILQTASHELTHFIQDYAPTEYGAYKQMAANVLMDRDGVTADELVRNYEVRYAAAGQHLSRDQIWDEIVSDGTGMMLNDENLIKQVTSENRSLAQKIVDFISDMIDSIKALISGEGISKSAKYLHENLQDFENIRDMWAHGIEQASDNYKSGKTLKESDNDVKEKILRRFQLEEADVDETKTLIAVHNLSADKLLKTLEYDGIPMPSIAVTKGDQGWNEFGDISLVFRKDTIDPKASRKNKVYGADAWTATFPQIEYDVDPNVYYKANRQVKNEAEGKIPNYLLSEATQFITTQSGNADRQGINGIVQAAKNNMGMKAAYLASKGIEVEDRVQQVQKPDIDPETEKMYTSYLNHMTNEEHADIRQMMENGAVDEIREKYKDKIADAWADARLERGDDPKVVEKAREKYKNGPIRLLLFGIGKAYDFKKNGIQNTTEMERDTAGINKEINEQVDESGYESWIKDLYKGVVKGKGVYNGKEYYTPSGNRRTFKQTHYDVTAENIVKSMLTQGDGDQVNTSGFYGIKTIRAAASGELKSIDEMHSKEGKIQHINVEEFDAKQKVLNDRLLNVIYSITTETGSTSYTATDNVGTIIQEAAGKKNFSEKTVRKVFSEYPYWKVSDANIKEITDIVNEAKEMPVAMFEAKPQRVVGYDEIAAAVVPNDTDQQILNALEEKGIPVVTYDETQENARKEAVNSLEGIRFQLEDVEQNVETDQETDRILRENQELREANEALKKQLTLTKDYTPRMEDITKTANKLLRDYHSKYSKEILVKNLSSLYNYMHSYEEGGYGQSMGEINRAAQAIARSIVQNASLKDEIGDEYKNVLKRIRSTKMVVPESYRTELDSEGGYDVFRKKYFGRLRLGNEGIDVDTAYEELSNLYPHLFPSDIINPADQILKIAQVYDDFSPQIKNPYHANMDEMTTIVANEIKEAAVNVRALPTTMADKMQAQIYRAQQEYRAKTEAYKARLKGEYDSDITEVEKNAKTRRSEINRQIHDLAEQYRSYGEGSTKEEQQQIRVMKKENWRQQEELRAERKALEDKVDFDMLAGKEKYQRRRDAAESRKHREKIRKDVDEMAKWLMTPTDQKHVPESLRKPLAEFLSGIDYSSNRANSEGEATARTNKWWDLTKQFDQIAKEGVSTDDGESLYMDVDPDLAEKMATLKDQVKDFDKLENLDLKSLRTLRDVVASMKHSIQDANKVFANNSYERVDQIAKDFLRENKERATKTIYTGARGSIDSMFRFDMLDAGTMFGRMGTAMETVYREQRNGFDVKVRDTKTAQDYMANVLEEKGIDSKELQTWTGKNAEKHSFEVQGGKVEFTTAQIMSLYELNKRAAAKEHIYNKLGGIKSAPTVEYDKKSHGYVVNKSTEPVSVSALDVQKITDTLTPQQKEIADSVVKFFTTVTSQWGNEVSMDMYGYKKFNAKNYFPIVSDKNYIATKESELGSTLTTLRNMGSTKHTVPHANNPIIIEDIFDVYTRQADQMSSYHAFVRPLADLQKVLNYKEMGTGSVKESIERTFGKDGLNYIKSLMIDLNGTSSSEKNFVAGLTKNMKSAAVGANLRTAIQQPTAYVRAAAEINPKYLVQGLKLHVSDAEWELCKQYAPIAQWKDWGYFDINTGRSMKSILMGPEGPKEKLVEKSMWLAGKGDEIAWKRLWVACQEETQDLHPELKKGSEEYYNQCGKRFSELIDKTQVVDSVLHRSKLMKSKDGLKQMYTSFMSEPTKTYNMLYRAIGDAAVKPTKETTAKLGRVLAVYVANAAATSLAAAVVDAMRNDGEDKKFLEKYEDALAENLSDNLDPVGILPVVKDIESIFSGYSVERTDLSAFQELYYAVSKWKSKLSGESDLTYPALLIDTAKPISTLTGMPVGNALKDLKALTNTIIQSIGSPDLNYSKNRFYRDIKNEGNIANYVALAMKQYADGNDTLGDQIIQDLKDTQINKIDERIKNKYVKILKEDERVQQAAGARLSGDYATYERLVGDLEKSGYDSEYIQKAIVGVGNAQDEKAHLQSGSTYNMNDVINAIQNGNDYTRVYKKIVEEKQEEAKKEGTKFDEKSVTSSLKSRLTATYKEAYVGGSQAERQKIRTTLYKVRINGKQLYSDDDFKDWIKSAKKK
ncbi:Uncharacterised protein [uncultured Clostridium sp.]|nr:Uncharacterised protein [uncultured Clostridium sp.]